jgi:hypothetical protein
MQKPLVTIENWAVIQKTNALRYDELQPGRRLVGKVVGHTAHPHAESIYTSPILFVDAKEGLVETHNTVYRLGKPSDEYKTWRQEQKMNAAA